MILRNPIIKGLILGLVAGLIVTLFDGFFILIPNIYVPASYPVLLICFNTIFWMTIGGLSGLTVWSLVYKREDRHKKEIVYWISSFLLPFALIYGLFGRVTIDKSLSKPFDHHLSFLWISIILIFLIFYLKKRITTDKVPAIFFIPEITAFVALFMFCSNISKMASITKWFSFLFSQDNLDPKNYMTLYEKFLFSVYAIGVLLILCFYFLSFFKISRSMKKQYHIIIFLFLIVCSSLTALFVVQHNSFVTYHYPSFAPVQIQETKKIPYVILIVLDTVRADRLSVYGPHKTTKNLAIFSREALVFENCIASSPWTLPSHASLFTGLYPVEHGSHHNLQAKKKPDGFTPTRHLSEKFKTLAEIFKEDGYQTCAIVSNFIMLGKFRKIHQGFQIYDCSRSLGEVYKFPFRPLLPLFCYLTNIEPKHFLPYRTAEDINKNVFYLLDKLVPDTFLLFINYMDAHVPYNPPRPFAGYFLNTRFPQLFKIKQLFPNFFGSQHEKSLYSFSLSQYDGELAYLDYHLGELFTQLKKKGIYDPALIIITSDHGDLFGEHGLSGHECSMYEGVIKVPLIIKFPFNQKVGREKRLITLSDLYTTILSICDLPVPEDISGKTFGQGSSPIVSEFYSHDIGAHRALYDGNYKFMKYGKKKDPELYDLEKDPLEQKNLAEALPDVTVAMEKNLQAWENEHKPKYPLSSETETFSVEVLEGLKALGYIK